MEHFLELESYVNPGSVFLLIGAITTGAMGKWVFGFIYDAKVKECEKWQELALHGTNLANRALREVA